MKRIKQILKKIRFAVLCHKAKKKHKGEEIEFFTDDATFGEILKYFTVDKPKM